MVNEVLRIISENPPPGHISVTDVKLILSFLCCGPAVFTALGLRFLSSTREKIEIITYEPDARRQK